MLYLLLCIISSTLIFIVFKLLKRLNVSTLNAIVVNYFTASALGLILSSGDGGFNPVDTGWFHISLISGFLFVFMFFIIGYASRVAGITLTSLTTKLSVVIPVLYSIIAFGEEVTTVKVAGMILAISAIILIVYPPSRSGDRPVTGSVNLWLPAILFFGAGFIDSLIKYSQEVHVPGDEVIAFATTTFMAAGVTSIFVRLVWRKGSEQNRWYSILIGGMALGIVNFGSLIFLIKALESRSMASSVVFGINNIGVVTLSVLSGSLIFGEKTSLINKVGIAVAIIAIYILFNS